MVSDPRMQEQGHGKDMKDKEETQTRDSMKVTSSFRVFQHGASGDHRFRKLHGSVAEGEVFSDHTQVNFCLMPKYELSQDYWFS